MIATRFGTDIWKKPSVHEVRGVVEVDDRAEHAPPLSVA